MSRPDDEAFNLDSLFGAEPTGEAATEVPPVADMELPPVTAAAPPAEEPSQPKRGLLDELREVNIFTIMLILSFLAITIGVIAMCIELGRYKWDTSARSARQTVSVTPAVLHLEDVPQPLV